MAASMQAFACSASSKQANASDSVPASSTSLAAEQEAEAPASEGPANTPAIQPLATSAPKLGDEYVEETFVLTPLRPEHTALDYQSVMANREYLRGVMGWGDWPSDSMTLDGDRSALENHFREFQDGEAFAFAVFSPKRKSILGCVYLYPESKGSTSVSLQYWVVESQLASNLDGLLLNKVLSLLPQWGFQRATHPVQASNARGSEIALAAGLVANAGASSASQSLFEWAAAP
jgi:hypothetical protein